MTRTVIDADILVFEPGNTNTTRSGADEVIEQGDIRKVDYTEKIQEKKDTATIEVQNNNAKYSSNVGVGDRLLFRTQMVGESSKTDEWTGLLRKPSFSLPGPEQNIMTLKCDDFVFGILSNRQVTDAFEDVQIAGASRAIIDTIIANEASEIGRSQISSITDTRSVEFQRTNLLEAINRMLKHTQMVSRIDGKDLVID
jgi:hypothetical protein